MIFILKLLLSMTILAVCIYAIHTFGYNTMLLAFCALSGIILLSVFFKQLNIASIVLARCVGGMSLVALALLLVASTIGGSFHMSESNQVIAVGLVLIVVFGCAFFLVKIYNPKDSP